MPTIGIIGMGWVGASVAISILHRGVAGRLLLNDLNSDLAEGEAMDLAHGAAFYPPAALDTASIEDMKDADVVVIAAGRGGKPGQSRLDLLRANAAVIESIGRRLEGSRGLLIVVTNPVDVLTWQLAKTSGLPPGRVIGTGTMLETARLRHILGRELNVDPRSVHAQVIGEHGDTNVVLWSGARIGGKRLRDWPGWSTEREAAIREEVRAAAYEIIKRKGATNHAIGLVTANLIRWCLAGSRRVVTVSAVQEGPYGLNNVALSLPSLVGRTGVTEVIDVELDDDETRALMHSAGVLSAAIGTIEPGADQSQ
jgi:L-lactate dehydrogenase